MGNRPKFQADLEVEDEELEEKLNERLQDDWVPITMSSYNDPGGTLHNLVYVHVSSFSLRGFL